MYETLGIDSISAPQAAVFFGLGLGALFGVLAQVTRFCLRRAVVEGRDRRQAAGIWLTALASAIFGTQLAVAMGWVNFEEHRFFASELPVLGIALGGIMFGIGMVLTRGCVSRLTVLAASGNLRALTVILIFAIVAHATLKGVFSPIRSGLGQLSIQLETSALPGSPIVWAILLGVSALFVGLRSGNRPAMLVLALFIGALVPLGWVGTGFILYDDFDPIAMETLSFTAPISDALFFTIASTAITPGFGSALIAGVLVGAFAAATISGQFEFQSFETPQQTGRYITGAVLMGIGGTLAGGCTVGAGLSGVPTLSLAASLALVAIIAGGAATDTALRRIQKQQPHAVPAE